MRNKLKGLVLGGVIVAGLGFGSALGASSSFSQVKPASGPSVEIGNPGVIMHNDPRLAYVDGKVVLAGPYVAGAVFHNCVQTQSYGCIDINEVKELLTALQQGGK